MSHFLFIFLYNTMEIFMKLIAHRGKIEKTILEIPDKHFKKHFLNLIYQELNVM